MRVWRGGRQGAGGAHLFENIRTVLLVKTRLGNRITGYEGELERDRIYSHVAGSKDTR